MKLHIWWYGPNESRPWIVSAEGVIDPHDFDTWEEAVGYALALLGLD